MALLKGQVTASIPARTELSNVNISGTYALDLSTADVFNLTMTANTTITLSNQDTNRQKLILLSGAFTPTFAHASWTIKEFGQYNTALSTWVYLTSLPTTTIIGVFYNSQ